MYFGFSPLAKRQKVADELDDKLQSNQYNLQIARGEVSPLDSIARFQLEDEEETPTKYTEWLQTSYIYI